jgi:hypothetical protein
VIDLGATAVVLAPAGVPVGAVVVLLARGGVAGFFL